MRPRWGEVETISARLYERLNIIDDMKRHWRVSKLHDVKKPPSAFPPEIQDTQPSRLSAVMWNIFILWFKFAFYFAALDTSSGSTGWQK